MMTPDQLRALAERLFVAMSFHDPDSGARKALIETVAYLRAQADAQPVAWMYEHDGCVDPPVFTVNRWTKCEEPWNESPLFLHPAPAAPAGWKLVPVKPTPEMLSAVGMMDGYDWHAPGCSPDADHANWYSAMIAAAPAASQGEPKRNQPLLDLLAVIHCDGGHHTEAVGIDQSIKDAQAAVCELKGKLAEAEPKREPRPCTCHPDDNPPVPCARKYALSECRAASGEPTEAQIKARDALLDFISENGTASEGVQHYLDRYVRAALAAKEQK